MKTKTIFIACVSLILLASCNGKGRQSPQNSSANHTQEVDTNKIYETWEVDTPPVVPR